MGIQTVVLLDFHNTWTVNSGKPSKNQILEVMACLRLHSTGFQLVCIRNLAKPRFSFLIQVRVVAVFCWFIGRSMISGCW